MILDGKLDLHKEIKSAGNRFGTVDNIQERRDSFGKLESDTVLMSSNLDHLLYPPCIQPTRQADETPFQEKKCELGLKQSLANYSL